jgi:protein-disulfide isomerase
MPRLDDIISRMTENPVEEPSRNPSFEQALARAGAAQPTAEEAQAEPAEAFIRFRRSSFYAVLLPVAFITGLAAGYLLWGRGRSSPPETLAAGAQPVAIPSRMDVSVDDDPSIGPANAPITIIEFSDFNCPYCRQFNQVTFKALMDSYPNKIRFVYRDYPITSSESYIAAQAAECAGDQDAYWAFHDALLSGQYDLGRDAYERIAKTLGLNSDALLACIDSGKYGDEVQKDAHDAASLGITGTPTFFVNGIPLVGAQPLNQFTRVIDSELN